MVPINVSYAASASSGSTSFFRVAWCVVASTFGFPICRDNPDIVLSYEIPAVSVSPGTSVQGSGSGEPVVNQYITNPTTIIREVVERVSGSGGGSGGSNFVTSDAFSRQVIATQDSIVDAFSGLSSDLSTSVNTASVSISSLTSGSVLFAGSSGSIIDDNSNFFWDDTNNRLGIGTSTPNTPLDIRGSTDQYSFRVGTGGTPEVLRVQAGIDNFSGYNLGWYSFSGTYDEFATVQEGARISAVNSAAWSSGSSPADLRLMTTPSGSTSPSERLRVTAAGYIGIADTSPDFALEVSTTTASGGYFGVTNSSDGDIFVVDENGYVGIGTSTPSDTLQVSGTASIRATGDNSLNLYQFGSNAPALMMFHANGTEGSPSQTLAGDVIGGINMFGYGTSGYSGGPHIRIRGIATEDNLGTSNRGTDLTFETVSTGGVTVQERMRLSAAGNLGIGTTTPSYPLHVNGTSRFDSAMTILRTPNTWQRGHLSFTRDSDLNQNVVTFYSATPDSGRYGFFIAVASSTVQDLSIDPDGNVGVGRAAQSSSTSNPAKLTVKGSGNTSSTQTFYVENSDSDPLFAVLDNGSVGVGTSTPNATVHIINSSGSSGQSLPSEGVYGLIVENAGSSNGSLTFLTATGAGYGLSVSNAGNVGIKKEFPGYALDIADATTNGRGLNIAQTATSGSNYGLVSQSTGSGATQNVGGYFLASGATTNYGVFINGPSSGSNNYALYAPATAKSYFAGNVGIGTTTPAVALSVVGESSFSATSTFDSSVAIGPVWDFNIVSQQLTAWDTALQFGWVTPDGTGAPGNYVSWGGGSSDILSIGGKGTGTGVLINDKNAGISGGNQAVTLAGYSTQASGKAYGAFKVNDNGASDYASFNIYGGTTNNPVALQPDGGNVGIGTTTPAAKIHALSSGAVTALIEGDTGGGAVDEVKIQLKGRNTYYWSLGMGSTAANVFQISYGASLGTNPFFAIDATGNVGIGTTVPSSTLHIIGSLQVGNPTGGDKGAGTINAVAVYDDNTLLTDYVFDYYFDGEVLPEDEELHGSYVMMTLDEMKEFIEENRHLPTITGRKEWIEQGGLSLGQLATQLWQTVETNALYISELDSRLDAIGFIEGSSEFALVSGPYVSKDNIGRAKILEGDIEVDIDFDEAYESVPVVNISPRGSDILGYDVRYSVVNESEDGFTIRLSTEARTDIEFNWHAFATRDSLETTISSGGSSGSTLRISSSGGSESNEETGEVAGDSTGPEDPDGTNDSLNESTSDGTSEMNGENNSDEESVGEEEQVEEESVNPEESDESSNSNPDGADEPTDSSSDSSDSVGSEGSDESSEGSSEGDGSDGETSSGDAGDGADSGTGV